VHFHFVTFVIHFEKQVLSPWPWVFEPRHVFPFVGLYELVALVPEELKTIDVAIYHNAKALCLDDGWWNTVPPGATPDAWIYNAKSTGFADPATNPRILDLSGKVEGERRLWRLPKTTIGPILSSLLHNVSHIAHSESEVIRLAIELRSLLVLRSNGGLGLFGTGKSDSRIVEDESEKLRGRQKKRGRRGGVGRPETRRQSYRKEGAEIIDRQRKARELL
jgi:hypothetical protein